jgi:hypothetical protein
MMELWVPRGNNWQTKLDIQIEEYRCVIARYKRDLVNLRGERAVIEYEAKNFRNTLDTLAKDCVVVSLTEFHDIKRLYLLAKKKITFADERIRGITDKVAEAESAIEDLLVKRDRAETKILEFKR